MLALVVLCSLSCKHFPMLFAGWPGFLHMAVDQACEGLGVAASAVEACLHRLVLHEEGSSFPSMADSSRPADLFAMLIINLPSSCRGGSMLIRHPAGATKTINLSGLNHFRATYVAMHAGMHIYPCCMHDKKTCPCTAADCLGACVLSYVQIASWRWGM